MTTTTAPTAKLICTECRHENELERLYCHNCGERLERSGVAGLKKAQTIDESRRRLQKMMEGPNKLRQNFFATSKLALSAALAAALVQLALPPEVPAPTKTAPQQIDLELENLASYQKPGPVHYSQDQVNAYLAYRLAGKKKALDKPFLTFVRATAAIREGECTIAMERSLFGYSLFSSVSYRIGAADKKLSILNTGAWIGRLPIHPAIMKFGDVIFADLWRALDREKKLMAKMGAVSFHDGAVEIVAPGK
jgi:hypothetical protein